ncbi:MAG: stage II sporulation protein M [Bacilli bacterium]|nr:stage II sporulation protein M [Bacilli bacterium]
MISFIKQNKVFSILIILTILSLIAGFIFYAKLDNESRIIVSNNIQKVLQEKESNLLQYTTDNMIKTFLIWILGISILGLPLILIIYLYSTFIFSFELCAMIETLGIKKIICILLYSLPRLIMIGSMFFLCFYAIHFSIYLFKYLFLHKDLPFLKIMNRYKRIYLYTIVGLILSIMLEFINKNYLLKIFY